MHLRSRATVNREVRAENLPSCPYHVHREVSFKKKHMGKFRVWNLIFQD